jgi:hypothetical protein
MSASNLPLYPPFNGSMRLATAKDLPRIAEVSVMGFKEIAFFTYARPDYKSLKYTQDTIDSVYDIYRAQLLDPRIIVVVVDDEWQPDEESDLLPASTWPKYSVVVGIMSLVFPEGSPRTGQFVVNDVGEPKSVVDRNLLANRLEILAAATKENQDKCVLRRNLSLSRTNYSQAFRRKDYHQ